MTSADCALRTPYGQAACRWRLEGRELTLEVDVPPNTSAIVRRPGSADPRSRWARETILELCRLGGAGARMGRCATSIAVREAGHGRGVIAIMSREVTGFQPGLDAASQWDSELRMKDMESQGVVAEVLFPTACPSRGRRARTHGVFRPRARPRRPDGLQPLAGRFLCAGAGPPGRPGPDLLRRCRAGRARHPLGS